MMMVMALCGVLAGILLFTAGAVWAWWSIKHDERNSQKRGEGRKGGSGMEAAGPETKEEAARQWQALYNFLNYDGSPMPAAQKTEGSSKRQR